MCRWSAWSAILIVGPPMSNSEMSCCGFIVPWSILSRLIAWYLAPSRPRFGAIRVGSKVAEAPAREALLGNEGICNREPSGRENLCTLSPTHGIGSESGFSTPPPELCRTSSRRAEGHRVGALGLSGGFRVAGQHGTHTLAHARKCVPTLVPTAPRVRK